MTPFAVLASVGIALRALRGAKLRSLLTGLGILIGVMAVVVVTALGTGAREQIGGQIDSLGANLIFIFSQSNARSGARTAGSGLTERDAVALQREASALSAVAVYSGGSVQVSSEFSNAKVGVMGVDAPYFGVRGFAVQSGRNFTPSEEQTKAKVALIGRTAQTKLFGNVDPIGRWVRFGRHAFLVVGTLVPKGQSPFEDQDDRLIIPIGTWRTRVSQASGDRVQLVLATVRSPDKTDQAVRQIQAILRQRHGIVEGDKDDFDVRTQQQFREQQSAVFDILTALLVSVAGIALFVGGVGVMNIMLVSVTERTREIGVRMAIGAKRADIQLQFLLEAMALTVIGGGFGLALAFGLTLAAERALGWELPVRGDAVLVAFVTSALVGLVFGWLPARRAATLDPIEALRHE